MSRGSTKTAPPYTSGASMSLRSALLILFASLASPALAQPVTPPAGAPASAPASTGAPPPAPVDLAKVSIIYTGKSLGALGILQDPDEHELLIEEATREKKPLTLATRTGWRAPGLALFRPGGALDRA